MTLFLLPPLAKLVLLRPVNRLSTKVLLLPWDMIPAVLLLPIELETIMLSLAPASIPTPLLLQVLLVMTLSLPPATTMPVALSWQVLLAMLAQAQDSQMPTVLSWQLLSRSVV